MVLSVNKSHFILDEYFRTATAEYCDKYMCNNRDCIYLYDPQNCRECGPPLCAWGFCIITCSPSHNHYAFAKNDADRYYMPIWSEEEILDCWRCCYSNIFDEYSLRKLFCQWGGSPRCVFASSKAYNHRFEDAMSNSHLIKLLVERSGNPRISSIDAEQLRDCQWLSHMHPTSDWQHFSYS